MNRSNSWKNFRKTFSLQSPSKSTNKQKPFGRKSSASTSKSEKIELHIDDSDEENYSLKRHCVVSSIKKRKPKEILSLNTTINNGNNSSVLDNSYGWNSDTDDSIDCSPELHDVSDITKTLPRKKQQRQRYQSLAFLSVTKSNQSTPISNLGHTPNVIRNKKNWSNIRNAFNCNTCATNLNETIIEAIDSGDETKSPPKKISRKIVENCIIDTPSTQQSIQIDSPKYFTPKDKKLTKLKCIKGGLLEHLEKAISRTKSDYSFWMNERMVDLVEAGEKLRIEKIEQSYGQILLYCTTPSIQSIQQTVNGSSAHKVLCLDTAYKKLSTLQVGKMIEVALESTGYVIENDLCFYPHISKILS